MMVKGGEVVVVQFLGVLMRWQVDVMKVSIQFFTYRSSFYFSNFFLLKFNQKFYFKKNQRKN